MPSSKGKPTDPKLHEEVKEEVKNQPTSKDGSGKGGWAAWKGAKLAKEYEAKGGDYENTPGTKNEPKKGTPEPKDGGKQDKEVKDAIQNGDAGAPEEAAKEVKNAKEAKKGGKKSAEEKTGEKKTGRGRPAKSGTASKKEKKEPTPGTRRSERVSKREAETNKEEGSAAKKQKK